MTRKSPTGWDAKPHKPIFYSPAARIADWRAGRGDGDAAIPDLPAGPVEAADPPAATTAYLEIRRRHFLDRSERERRHMLTDLEPVHRQLAAVRQDIAGCEEKVTEIRERLDAIPEVPGDAALTRRNAVEQHAPDELVRARRQREHDAKRGKVLAELEQAADRLRALRVEEARLSMMIDARERILATRVGQLHEHTLRRCGTYRHYLVRKHPDGNALIPFLNLALPTLPDWLPRRGPDTADPDAGAADRAPRPPTPISPAERRDRSFIPRREAR
ncbi:MAG: hypothetical protein ACRDPY_11925 [Streptosporangiaceae bacterium]